jgi:hypothetical protein
MKTRRVVKTKKALKRLDRIEALLSKVIHQYATDEGEVRELLDSARASVVRAKVKAKAPAKVKPLARAKSSAKAKSLRSAGVPEGTRLKAQKNKKNDQTTKGKRRRKRIPKSRASRQSNAPKVRTAAREASIPPDLPDADTLPAIVTVG